MIETGNIRRESSRPRWGAVRTAPTHFGTGKMPLPQLLGKLELTSLDDTSNPVASKTLQYAITIQNALNAGHCLDINWTNDGEEFKHTVSRVRGFNIDHSGELRLFLENHPDCINVRNISFLTSYPA